MRLNKLVFSILTVVLLLPLVGQSQLPDFSTESVVSGLFGAVSGAILPDDRMIIIHQSGTLLITSDLDQDPVSTSFYMSLTDIDATAEHGLLEILLDPDFENNNYFYLYYTPSSIQVNRLSRFTHNVNSSSMATEFVVWESPDTWSDCCHVGGAMAFLPDSTLLLGVGDDFNDTLPQDLGNSHGKLHRINRDGSIPSDNPFFDLTPGLFNANGELKSIYAYGLRNPFRGAYDKVNDRFFIGEVGGNDHSVAWEDVHLAEAGANFGFPFCGEVGREPDGSCTDNLYSDPVFTYPHAGVGASITAGMFYSGANFPVQWQGRFFYGDWVRNWLRYLEFDDNGTVVADAPFIDQGILGGEEALTIVKILQGHHGELYYFSMFEDFVNYTGALHRVEYTGPKVLLDVRVLLEGPYNTLAGQMLDALRQAEFIPTTEPFTALGFTHYGNGGGEAIEPEVLKVTGPDAIVDWVLVELRDKNNNAQVLSTRSALLQRDGDVVDLDGYSKLFFDVVADDYFVAIRHRNHLGVMTLNTYPLSGIETDIDFTSPSTPTFGTAAQKSVNGTMVMWMGNTYMDNKVKYTGINNDRDLILSVIGGAVPTLTLNGYYSEDCTMDGVVKYTGLKNDRDPILVNIGGAVPTSTRSEQLP